MAIRMDRRGNCPASPSDLGCDPLHDRDYATRPQPSGQTFRRRAGPTETEVAEERRLAEARLKTQQDQSEKQFRTEQSRMSEREQYAEAYAVRVTVGEFATASGSWNEFGDPDADTKRLAALVVNEGTYAITRVTAQFSPEGRSLTSPSRVVRIPAIFESLPKSCEATSAPFRTRGDTVTRSLHGTPECGSRAATWACSTLLDRISWSAGWTGGERTGSTSKVWSSPSLRVSRGHPKGKSISDTASVRVVQPVGRLAGYAGSAQLSPLSSSLRCWSGVVH